MTENTVNVPLLRKAVEWAEAEAASEGSRWDQSDYVTETPCGTAYCVAGWVLHEAGWTDAQISAAAPKVAMNEGSASRQAAQLLGIPVTPTHGDGSPLFSAVNTIKDVRRIAEEIAGERL